MGKVGQMVLEIQKEWMKLLTEKNDYIAELEECLDRGEEAYKALSKKVDDLLRDKRELSKIIAENMDRTDDGELYIKSIWETTEKYQYHRILDLLDIPLSEKEIKNEN